MINNINITDELFEYAVTIRRKLHEYPEIGFELSKTVAPISDSFADIISKANLTTEPINQKMSSEDFGWYLTKAPGMLFRFGTGNPSIGADKPAHRNDFIIDENGMKSAIKAFCLYAINYSKKQAVPAPRKRINYDIYHLKKSA